MLAVAERFGQLPDTVETEMSEYWFNRAITLMTGEAMDMERRNKARKK